MKLKTLSVVIGLGLFASSISASPFVQCGKTADSFAFILDVSGSMMENVAEVKKEAELPVADDDKNDDLTRMDLVKTFIKQTVTTIEQKTTAMDSGLFTVAPYAELIPTAKRSAEEFSDSLQAIPDTLEIFGRPTWLGERSQARFNQKLAHPEALVLITDGHFESFDEKMSPVQNLQSFYKANPNACIHIVSVAYRNEEKTGIEQISGVKDCSTVTHIDDLLNNQQIFENFISNVYYRDCVMEINGINFDFDKAVLKETESATLLEAIAVLKARAPNEPITIRGWTDWIGSDAYNQKLSLKRAEAVRDFFITHGLNANVINVEGKGKSFKYSNKTADGRWMNRRVEIIYGKGLISKDATSYH